MPRGFQVLSCPATYAICGLQNKTMTPTHPPTLANAHLCPVPREANIESEFTRTERPSLLRENHRVQHTAEDESPSPCEAVPLFPHSQLRQHSSSYRAPTKGAVIDIVLLTLPGCSLAFQEPAVRRVFLSNRTPFHSCPAQVSKPGPILSFQEGPLMWLHHQVKKCECSPRSEK